MTSPRDTGGGGQGSFVRRTARRPSPSRRLCRRSPRSLLLPLPPPAFPPGSGSILTAPLEESQRPGLLRLLLRGKGDEGPRGVPLLCVALVTVPFVLPISLFPILLPPHLPPPPRCVYCCVARRVDGCAYFVLPIPPRAFRVVSGVPLRRSWN